MAESKGSVGAAIAWMFGIWCLLFWLPLLGPFVAGLVGGKKAGSVGSAIGAVFLPSIVVAVLTFAAGAGLSGEAALGVLAGAGAFLVVVANVGPLLVGAIIGGLFA